ncbi:hypothetical protein MBLNU459_g0460t1 [Dothideomycetes sp. NU459]
MSTAPIFEPIQTTIRQRPRPRALVDINYNALSSNDIATSSEDEAPELDAIAPSDAQSIVGVSLGRQQTRLTSPETPSAEKAVALDEAAGGFFGDGQIHEDAELDEEDEKADVIKSDEATAGFDDPQRGRLPQAQPEAQPSPRLPSPWRAGPKHFKKADRRASGQGSHTLETWRNNLMSSIPSMPSLPKHFTFNSPFSFGHGHGHGHGYNGDSTVISGGRKRSGSLFTSLSSSNTSLNRDGSAPHLTVRAPTAQTHGDGTERNATASLGIETPVSRQFTRTQSKLRRSASDTSLQTFRTGNSLSRVPSLGDDSRFEHVQGQVNSRFKAIKDSWQDTNFNLPSLPNLPSISNISLASTLPIRTSSVSRKPYAYDSRQRELNRPAITSPSAPPTPQEAEIKRILQNQKTSGPGALSGKAAVSHPHFTKALHELTGDVVVLGGYRGSILRSAEPPNRQVWVPIKVGLNIRKVDLEVGLDATADETMEEKIIPGGMLSHIGPVDISKRLFKRLRACDNARAGRLRVHDYGYDWRLDPNYLSKRMIQFLEKLPCNQPGVSPEKRGAIVVAHSLGGLITRHAVNQRPDLFAGVVYAGVPKTCVNILGPFRNGDDVLLSSRVLTAQVNFTIRTSFALLPLDGRCFFNKQTKEEYPVDFFDPQTWADYRLSPCIARPLPPLDQPQLTGLAGIMNSMASVLPGRKGSISVRSKQAADHPASNAIGGLAQPPVMGASSGNQATAEARGNIDYEGTDNKQPAHAPGASASQPNLAPAGSHDSQPTSVGTTVTLPREACLDYLARILADVKRFKQQLAFDPAHGDANAYPPAAVIYGKTTPTVFGARVASREAIKHADAYDELAFASGDGVVLARAAMLPDGYRVAKGGVVSSDRGHVTLLGDLEAVGRCLRAVMVARRKGVGMGTD